MGLGRWWARLFGPSPEQQELVQLRASVARLTEEVRRLTADPPPKTIVIERVDRLIIEKMHHTIEKLEVQELSGTLNVGLARNVRLGPRPAELTRIDGKLIFRPGGGPFGQAGAKRSFDETLHR